jgi:hypothetical protein
MQPPGNVFQQAFSIACQRAPQAYELLKSLGAFATPVQKADRDETDVFSPQGPDSPTRLRNENSQKRNPQLLQTAHNYVMSAQLIEPYICCSYLTP